MQPAPNAGKLVTGAKRGKFSFLISSERVNHVLDSKCKKVNQLQLGKQASVVECKETRERYEAAVQHPS